MVLPLLTLCAALTAEPFEGRYAMQFSDGRNDLKSTFWVKGGDIKMEFSGRRGMEGMGQMVLREGSSKILIIIPQQRAYLEMPIPNDPSLAEVEKRTPEDMPFEKTGETREILGYTAHQYLLEKDGEKMEIWATDALGAMPFARNQMLQGYAASMRKVAGLKDFFPLETIVTRNGKETARMTVTEVVKENLSEKTFMAPPAYKPLMPPGGMRPPTPQP